MVNLRIIIGAVIVVGLLAGMSVGVQAQSDNGLVAEWLFDEGSGNVLEDSSGKGNDGVIYGATWTEGKIGGALSFDGLDDYVEVPHPGYLAQGTIEGRVYFVSAPSSIPHSGWMWFTITGKPINQRYDGVDFGVHPKYSQNLVFGIYDGGWYWADSGIRPQSGKWYHFAGIWGSGGIKIYIDGDLQGQNSYTGGIPSYTKYSYVGANTWGGYVNAIIDEVRIYNRALSAEEIKAHYEQGQTTLSIAKTVSPHSTKQGQTTTITLTIKNTGTTEIKDIEVADSVPVDFILISGETSKKYASLKPGESRDFQFVIQSSESGTFDLGDATATYADEKGNYYTAKSNTAEMKVISSLESTSPSTIPTPTKTPSSASVNLYGEKTEVVLGEDILLRLSAVNLITKPPMTVQVIIIPPSGMSVTSAEFTKAAAGQYTTTYKLEPGDGKDIGVRIKSNQVGEFVVEGRIVYYFGDDRTTGYDHTLTLPIKVTATQVTPPPASSETSPETQAETKTPGFEVIFAIAGLLVVAYLVVRKK